jgi:hypothetical protein
MVLYHGYCFCVWFDEVKIDLEVLGAVVYHIWRQRNDIKHGNLVKTEEQVIKSVEWEIRSRVMGVGRFKQLAKNRGLFCKWGIEDKFLL